MKYAMFARFLATVLLVAGPAVAQRDLGSILGTISDPQGAVIAGAKVLITEDATGLKYTAESDEGGNYIRSLLKAGTYSIEVEAPGFKKAVQRGILLGGGDRVGVNLQLTVGEITQSVEVEAIAPLLQTENTTLGDTMQAKTVSELPLGGQRKFTYLARLAPGVVPSEQGARDAAGGGFSANGVRSNGQNNFLLNGVDNNVNVIDFINQTSYVIGPSVEAIGEMRVMTNGYSAEYGRGAGGVVNVTIKSGTNDIHGTVFEFLQNDKVNANIWENNRAGKDRGPFKQNQYGVAIGGPLIKNRTFWFADWQGTRIRSTGGAVPGLGNTFVKTIPRPEFKNGDFSSLLTGRVVGTDALGRNIIEGAIYDPTSTRLAPNGQYVRDPFAGNIIPANRFDPAAKRLIDLYPTPNQNLADRIPGNNFINVTTGAQDNDQFDVRIDHRLTDKDMLFGSLSWSNENKTNTQPFPGALDGTDFGGREEMNLGRNAMLSYTRVWTPTFLTETRLAFSRLVTERVQANSDQDLFTEYGIGGLNPTGPLNGGLPNIQPEGYSNVGGSEWLPTKEYSNVWDFIQNVSINKGSNSLKFGYEYRPIEFPFYQVPTPRGTFQFQRNRTNVQEAPGLTGDGIASWLLGYPGNSTITTQNFISSEKVAHAFYFQDDWRINSKLTINLGVRYELFSPISEKFGRQSTYDWDRHVLVIPEGKDQDAPLPPNFATSFPDITVERGLVSKYLIPWDKTNVGPRIGIAYRPFDRSVFRIGYGIFYGGEENQGGNPNRGEGVPFNQTQNLNLENQWTMNPFLTTFTQGWPTNVFNLPANISFRTIDPNFRNPLVHKWNFTIQQELGWNTALEVGYIGSHGAHQVTNWDSNSANNDPRPGIDVNSRRPQPFLRGGIQRTSSFGRSNYHGLAGKLEKRYSNGLDFTASYTWGHVLADTNTPLSTSTGWALRDVNCFSCEYADAGWDIRHRFVYSAVYDIPFGRGKAASSGNAVVNTILGNWQVNSILTLSTGQPFTLRTRNAVGSFLSTRPDAVPGKHPNQAPAGGRTPDLWFDITAVNRPVPNTLGNLGNQTNRGPGIKNVDLSLFKDFPFTERFKVQFRAESFNLTNTPQYSINGIGNEEGSGNFGRIAQTLPGTARNLQFALRFMF